MADEILTEVTTEETCELKSFERNKYFYGKLMTVRDFETEQRYYKEKSNLLNRLIHGIGLVCGLEVSAPAISDDKLRINLSPGVALDCCGHEIVVEGASNLEVEGTPTEGLNYIYIRYRECLKEPVPALANPAACEQTCCYSRIKENFKLEVSSTAPVVPPFDWEKIWQDRKTDIQDVASHLNITDNTERERAARLIITADEYFKVASCPSCEDTKVLLAVVRITGANVVPDNDETLAIRSIVYSNPMLHELLKSHLTDLDNPHNVTAEQIKALVSIDGVENPGGNVDLVKDNAITITPDNTNKRITIGESHSARVDNPHQVTAEQVGALVSIGGLSNPGGGVDLIAGIGIEIDHPALIGRVLEKANPRIRITATNGATTGAVRITIPKATAPMEVTRVVAAIPGYTLVKDIKHGLDTKLTPLVVLGIVAEKQIIMGDDFITQRTIIEILAKEYGLPAPPLVAFKPLAMTDTKFDIIAVNMNPQAEETITVCWWAVPAARRVVELPLDKIVDGIKTAAGDELLNQIARERNVPVEEVGKVIGGMVESIAVEATGMTIASISKATNLEEATIKPVLTYLVESKALEATGRGATRKFVVKEQ